MSGHAAVVLAAGSSTRLGRPKQLLRRDGETLLHRMVRLARGTAPSVLVVVLPEASGLLTDAVSDLDCVQALNPDAQRGMGSSLLVAAPSVQALDHVLVVACDQPALEAAHLDALLDSANRSASGCAATLLLGTLGVPAVVPGAWFADLADGQGDSGFRARLRALEPGTVGVLHAPALALDIDTPDDLRAAHELGLIDD
ncbi:nucleotidyltransferase family protein [Stenotrophomonas sp. PS02300]|uniref:nucleotidyltransferase family protein n=1 Tax=Stenotrophomonas sp. PS02300 TaxID=2991426 RepID=UPI00249CDB86|nr:nucleotidyltransferase family protein [Stenotrophomonas sp. PS02300]